MNLVYTDQQLAAIRDKYNIPSWVPVTNATVKSAVAEALQSRENTKNALQKKIDYFQQNNLSLPMADRQLASKLGLTFDKSQPVIKGDPSFVSLDLPGIKEIGRAHV